ncbi:MAG: amidohydrolase, partial [Xanthomonadales bacterium]|nr:amidohydrolase [Xanthomonadales bacterium]
AKAAGRELDGDWQPDGGHIERIDGKATGVFIDGAMGLVAGVVPQDDPAEVEAALAAAFHAAVAVGLTGVHDAGVPLGELGVMRRMADAGKLPLRIYAMADADNAALDMLCALGAYRHPGGRLQMRAVKLYIDGALGSRGAALLADYSDDPHNRGLLVTEPAEYRRIVQKARRCDVQVASHAIGDRGNRLVLDTYEAVFGKEAGGDLRWRDEHSQIVDPADIPRFAKLGVIASMQPTHATSDGPWAEQRLGSQRMAGAYAWRSLLDSGARLAFGSDFPVESENPMLGLYAAVTRQDREGHPTGGWQPAQRLTPAEALRGFTLDAAYAGFAEDEVGSLKPGKRADFVILSADPLTADASKIDDITVLSTWVDGQAVYRADD